MKELKTIIIKNENFSCERALYGLKNLNLENCSFKGDEDGESALKESGNITAVNCDFELRYPLWHVRTVLIDGCGMTETCRAALWYCRNVTVNKSSLCGIKALRECKNTAISECTVRSSEFGWKCSDIQIDNTLIESEYPFLMCKNIKCRTLRLKGKYSFQYVRNAEFINCDFDTKDAFWHSKNVTVRDSIIKGEYLGWYSHNLHLINCKIIGTQPLCYCKGLVLENCITENCDLAFERSEVTATVKGHIDSIKNPVSGCIYADSVGEIITEKGFDKCLIEVKKLKNG